MSKTNIKRGGFMKGRLLTIILGASLILASSGVWAQAEEYSLKIDMSPVSAAISKYIAGAFDGTNDKESAISFVNDTCRWRTNWDSVVNAPLNTLSNLWLGLKSLDAKRKAATQYYDLATFNVQEYYKFNTIAAGYNLVLGQQQIEAMKYYGLGGGRSGQWVNTDVQDVAFDEWDSYMGNTY